jgi:hypothetical protein
MCVQPPHDILLVEDSFAWWREKFSFLVEEKFNVNDDDFPLFFKGKGARVLGEKFFIIKPVLTSDEEHCFSEMKIHIIPLNEQSLMSALRPFMLLSGDEEELGGGLRVGEV